jgi:hypothetical protein
LCFFLGHFEIKIPVDIAINIAIAYVCGYERDARTNVRMRRENYAVIEIEIAIEIAIEIDIFYLFNEKCDL